MKRYYSKSKSTFEKYALNFFKNALRQVARNTANHSPNLVFTVSGRSDDSQEAAKMTKIGPNPDFFQKH